MPQWEQKYDYDSMLTGQKLVLFSAALCLSCNASLLDKTKLSIFWLSKP